MNFVIFHCLNYFWHSIFDAQELKGIQCVIVLNSCSISGQYSHSSELFQNFWLFCAFFSSIPLHKLFSLSTSVLNIFVIANTDSFQVLSLSICRCLFGDSRKAPPFICGASQSVISFQTKIIFFSFSFAVDVWINETFHGDFTFRREVEFNIL